MEKTMQSGKRMVQASGYEWDMTWKEDDIEEHGWIRGSSLLHAFETIASAHVDEDQVRDL